MKVEGVTFFIEGTPLEPLTIEDVVVDFQLNNLKRHEKQEWFRHLSPDQKINYRATGELDVKICLRLRKHSAINEVPISIEISV